jgi:hypothetical protein
MIVKKTKQLGNFKKGINLYVPKKRIASAAPSGIPVASTTAVNVVFGSSSYTYNREAYPSIIYYAYSPQADNTWIVILNFNYEISSTWVLSEYSIGFNGEGDPEQGPLSIRATNSSTNSAVIPTTGWTYTLGTGPTVTITAA